MKEFLQLIRWKNLLIVTLTMVLMRYFVISPLLSQVKVALAAAPDVPLPMMLQLPLLHFILLIAATLCITAGGYVINDYFDIRTDLVNRGNIIVGNKISRRKAILWHSVFNIAGVSMGFYVSYRAGLFWMGLIFLVVSGLLYFYSASYKRQFLIGNLVVAFLTAMVPFLVVLYEWPSLYRYYTVNAVSVPEMSFLFYWVGGFALFAFLTTLTREIIKDIEDFEGDRAYGRNTLPVVTGIPASKIISTVLAGLTILLLYIVWFLYVRDWITLIYISAAIVVPLVLVICRVICGSTRRQIHGASSMMKIAMLTGILYSLVVKAIIYWKLL
ncbi:MAG: geranylgeranylglycerol-phosphate geranylgeranyltransferase [Bacteroidales bacterium]|nr:geranylgeranylglycerol-phosphate geranylgeranyltransferase [Bacteroidales bacterium]MBN2632818.1 geranylgeranylglycerol-phosphate geranylgeranyltransferase [Bacteroidales bacterium]